MTSKATELPRGVIADTLNLKTRRIERSHRNDDTIPRMHVSSLIKSSTSDFFCEREFVLRYMERREAAGAGIPPKFALLYAVGHYYGEYMVQEFLRRNPKYAEYAWGDWRCVCGACVRRRQCLPKGKRCKRCKKPIDRYVEVDLFNPAKTVIGHADLIFCVNGVFYVYEFKSIDRADVNFEEIRHPLGDHLLQASNYYFMLKAEGKTVNPYIRFVYADRSMQGLYTQKPFREVEGKRVPSKRLRNIYLRARRVHTGIQKGVLPRRKCDTIKCSRAKTCSVAISCFNRKTDWISRIPSD